MKLNYLLCCCLILAIADDTNAYRRQNDPSIGRRFIDRREPMEHSDGWRKIGRALPEEEVTLIMALKQSNLDAFFSAFKAVTDPSSPSYGNWMSVDDYTNLLAPSSDVIANVTSWLHAHDITNYELTKNRDFIKVRAPVSKAERLLDAEYYRWEHPERRTVVTRSLGPYTAPHHVAGSLDFVVGHIGLPRHEEPPAYVKKKRADSTIPITPAVLRTRYNVTPKAIGGNPKNRQAVAEFKSNWFDPEDIERFFKQYWPGRNYTTTVAKIIGGNKPNHPTLQASMDLQYIMGVAPNVETWYWANPGDDFFSDLTDWVTHLSNTEDIPAVHAVSYGNNGEGPSQEYRDRVSVEFAKLGARGISVIVASGDFGTGCYMCYWFEPSFPATSPYVTAVGATTFKENKIGDEMATTSFGSGGGFAWNFEKPEWQGIRTTHYLQKAPVIPANHFFNGFGRGIPDVSALGTSYHTIVDGVEQEMSGSATATVTFAALVSLLNEVRLDHNLPTLGFLNPWLYKVAEHVPNAFYDITEGSNHHGCCGMTGFKAWTGWDPVTGLGTPNYAVLRDLVLNKNPLDGVHKR